MENTIQLSEQSPLTAATEFLKVSGDMDVAKLKELLDLQERWENNQAKKAYVQAMAEFKKNAPAITKDKHVKFLTQKGVTEYDHATLFSVTEIIGEALSKHALTASWATNQTETLIKVTCKITHVLGHSEETTLFAPADVSGGKNAIQAIGSTVTYLQRYTLLALTGLATKDQDDDGNTAVSEDEKRMAQVKALRDFDKQPLTDSETAVLNELIEHWSVTLKTKLERLPNAIEMGESIMLKTKKARLPKTCDVATVDWLIANFEAEDVLLRGGK